MNTSSLHKSYCARSDVMPETPQSHFHSSLKSNLSLADRRQCNTPCFCMHHFTLYKETQFAIKVHLLNWTLKWKKKREFQLEPNRKCRAGWSLWLTVLCTHSDKKNCEAAVHDLYIPQSGCNTHLSFRWPCPILSVNQACPLWSCSGYNRKNLFPFCSVNEVL